MDFCNLGAEEGVKPKTALIMYLKLGRRNGLEGGQQSRWARQRDLGFGVPDPSRDPLHVHRERVCLRPLHRSSEAPSAAGREAVSPASPGSGPVSSTFRRPQSV